jgi:hypothetical protein
VAAAYRCSQHLTHKVLSSAFSSGPGVEVDDALSCDVFNDGEFPISIQAVELPTFSY